ncbi:unnamed protein product [Rotaria socialis]|uniref:TIR domain-containing protein n=1 Tax=Rotaria socialis TaxID=392032 RepID=A0A818T0E5_9BILA|nr:unnamed protein product [Rotaria socialis]
MQNIAEEISFKKDDLTNQESIIQVLLEYVDMNLFEIGNDIQQTLIEILEFIGTLVDNTILVLQLPDVNFVSLILKWIKMSGLPFSIQRAARTVHEVELPTIVADSTPRSSVVKLENKRLRIMISYSHADSDFCHQLADALEEGNLFALWVDFDYCHTDDLWEEIGQTIENCDIILFLMTKDYQASKLCRQEVMYAKDSLKKRFVPVYLTRDFPASSWLGVRIVGPQYIRFGKKPFDVTVKDLKKLILEEKGDKNLKTKDSKVSAIEPPSETKEDENSKSNEDSPKQDPENSNQSTHETKPISKPDSKPIETSNSQDIADWFDGNKVRPELKKIDFSGFTEKQLQTLLNIEHIRQHLMEVGLIDRHGQVTTKHEYERSTVKHRSRRRVISNKNIEKFQTPIHRELTAATNGYSKSGSIDQKLISSAVRHTRKVIKYYILFYSSYLYLYQGSRSQSPKRYSSAHRSSRAKSALDYRVISPKPILNNKRCVVTMIYYGSQTKIDYKRNCFYHEDDEIIVMQQHCGGENVIVYKDALQPNKIFEFESRRHPDYPFALTFYVNGLIDNRLSICCESRYKHNVRLSGKRGLFGIVNVQKSKACKRCQTELRMKKLAKLKAKNKPMSADMLSTDSNPTETTSPEATMRRAMASQGRYESASHLPIEPDQQKVTTDLARHINILNENLLFELDKNLRQEVPISKQTSDSESYESIVSAAKNSSHKKAIILQQSNTDFNTLNGD